jgi:aspartyl aminopeptidase
MPRKPASAKSPPPQLEPADAYASYLHAAPTPFHAVQGVVAMLKDVGFATVTTADTLDPSPGARLCIVHPDGKSVIAVIVGRRSPVVTGYAVVGAHTDSPDLRLRLNPLTEQVGTVQWLTQFHGGLIRRSWLDRPLTLAGATFRVTRDRKGTPVFHKLTGLPVVERRLLHLDAPLAVIPDVAIHLDRDKNDKGAVNPATQLNAVIASSNEGGIPELMARLSAQAGVALDEVDGFDLHLVPWQPPVRTGLDRSLLTGPRHDDLAMVWCGAEALRQSVLQDPSPVRTRVAAFFDAEETGSTTASGAASAFLRDVLVRLARRHPDTAPAADVEQAFAHTMCLSGDMAHAHHPNFAELHDRQHAPRINQGVVVKANSNDRYATTGETVALFNGICDAAGVAVQDFVVRQDMACGTTIGPIVAASLAARVVDVGCPMWAMHSAAETLGVRDLADMVAAMRTFYLGAA